MDEIPDCNGSRNIKHERACFIRISNIVKRAKNTARSRMFLGKMEVVRYSDQTRSRVLDISSQTNR